jgi:hypothetical protein
MIPSSSNQPRNRMLGLLLLLSGLEFFLRSPVLLGGVALHQRDLFLLYFPLVQSVLRALSEGALPLRDPTSAFGQPLLADPSCQILYPPVMVHLFFPPHQAYAWFVSMHSVFGAMGVAFLARRLSGGSFAAACGGGLAWLLCGPLQSLTTLWHHMSGAAWIPWVVLCVIKVTTERSTRSAVVLGAVFGGQILAGSADMCAMTALLCAVFVVPLDLVRLLRAWVIAGAVALTLSAGVWLPAAELVRNSARSALPEAVRTYWSLHPLLLLEFFLPIPLSGLPLRPEWRAAMFEGREPFLASVFLGAAILPLALAALADAAVPRRLRIGAAVSICGGLLIALGKNAFAYSLAVSLLPPLKILRFPSKAVIPVAIVLCALAGVGLVAISRSSSARRAAMAGALVLAAAALALTGPLQGALATALLNPSDGPLVEAVRRDLAGYLLGSVFVLALLLLRLRSSPGRVSGLLGALLLAGHLLQSHTVLKGFPRTVSAAVLEYKPEALHLMRPPDDGRLYVYDYGLYVGFARKHLGRDEVTPGPSLQRMGPEAASVVSTRAYLSPMVGAFWNVDYAWDGDLRLLFDRRLSALTVDLRRVEGTPGFLRLLQISGVSRVVALHEDQMEDLKLVAREKIHFDDDLRVFDVPAPRPRAYLTSGRTLRGDSDLNDLLAPGFDPARSVLVDGGEARPPDPAFMGEARVISRRADRLTVETSANASSFLTVLEGIMPGWRVLVDGRPAAVERANAMFIGTEVPAGRHVVEFRFLPRSAVMGVGLTALCAAGILLYLLPNRRAPGKA